MNRPALGSTIKCLKRILGRCALAGLLLGAGAGIAQQRDGELLEEDAYRTDLEEIIVHGQAPRWRNQGAPVELRPEEIEFFEQEPEPRLEWFPPYTRDERDKYRGVRDRKNATPELQLFEIHF